MAVSSTIENTAGVEVNPSADSIAVSNAPRFKTPVKVPIDEENRENKLLKPMLSTESSISVRRLISRNGSLVLRTLLLSTKSLSATSFAAAPS